MQNWKWQYPDNATTNHHNAENNAMLATLNTESSAPRRPRQGRTRASDAVSAASREREYISSGATNVQKQTEESDALLRKLRAM